MKFLKKFGSVLFALFFVLTLAFSSTVNTNAIGKKCLVVFHPNNGNSSWTSTKIQGGTYGSLKTVSKYGYEFDGWYTANSGGSRVYESSIVPKTARKDLYAHFTAKTMRVTLSYNYCSSRTSKTVTYGSTYGYLRTPTRIGYEFDGWYTTSTGGSKVTSSTKVTKVGNHTLYAHWTKKKYTVTLRPGNGRAAAYITVYHGDKYKGLYKPTRTGYIFKGWYTSPYGGVRKTEFDTVTKSHTLYAQWRIK